MMENARVKAEILCKASGNALEQLLNIDYNRGKLNVFSGKSCDVEGGIQPFMAMSRCTAFEIEPDDIDELKEKDGRGMAVAILLLPGVCSSILRLV